MPYKLKIIAICTTLIFSCNFKIFAVDAPKIITTPLAAPITISPTPVAPAMTALSSAPTISPTIAVASPAAASAAAVAYSPSAMAIAAATAPMITADMEISKAVVKPPVIPETILLSFIEVLRGHPDTTAHGKSINEYLQANILNVRSVSPNNFDIMGLKMGNKTLVRFAILLCSFDWVKKLILHGALFNQNDIDEALRLYYDLNQEIAKPIGCLDQNLKEQKENRLWLIERCANLNKIFVFLQRHIDLAPEVDDVGNNAYPIEAFAKQSSRCVCF